MNKLVFSFFAALSVLTSMGQSVGSAFYVYRNDGQFHAFFREEVDSMAYSCYDADSVLYNEFVSQVVYTADSVYRIPIAAIDSVSFVTPETVLNSNVFALTEAYSDFVITADTLGFTLLPSTPAEMRPEVGHVVVASAECTAFPDGIIARVVAVHSTADGFVYTCSKAYFDDVFDQIVVHEQLGTEPTNNSDRRAAAHRVAFSRELWDKKWTEHIAHDGTTTTFDLRDLATATVTIRKTLTTPFYAQIALKNELTSSVELTAESSVSNEYEMQIGSTVTAGRLTIPNTANLLWLEPKLSLFGFFEEQGNVKLSYSGHFNRSDEVTFTYTQGQWTFDHTPTTDVGTDVAELSMEGYAEIGLKPQIDFSVNGQQAGFGLSGKAGLKESVNFLFDATQLYNGGLYEAMRDSYCRTTIPWSITTHANANVFARYNASHSGEGPATFAFTFAPDEEPQWGEDRYIFPLFDNVSYSQSGSESIVAQASLSRTLLLPVKVGFVLIDDDNTLHRVSFSQDDYQAEDSFATYACQLTGLEGGSHYVLRPCLKWFGYDISASPTTDVELEEVHDGQAIDLGLSVKWASHNVGASSPEESGGYYAWGETSTKSFYGWDSYGYFHKVVEGHTYWWLYDDIGDDISGTQYDAARVNWGGEWRMPTYSECMELFTLCQMEETTLNGVKGARFTGPNGNSIFLPAESQDGISDNGIWEGRYWTSTATPPMAGYDWPMSYSFWALSGFDGYYGKYDRSAGMLIRPVTNNAGPY